MRVAMCFLVCMLVASVGCGNRKKVGVGPAVPADGSDGGSDVCIDKDMDGYGPHCSAGPDCNDHDPNITDECVHCVTPNQDCPCTPGTKFISCKPPTRIGDGGTYVCSEGTRYCRGGFWSACEIIGQYIFVKN